MTGSRPCSIRFSRSFFEARVRVLASLRDQIIGRLVQEMDVFLILAPGQQLELVLQRQAPERAPASASTLTMALTNGCISFW